MVLDFIQENLIGISQVALSLALVVATVAYTSYTKDQTEEMKATRENSNQPVLRGGILTFAPTLVMGELKNTGNGAAHEVTATICFADIDTESVEFKIPILSPGEDCRFTLPLDGSDRSTVKMNKIERNLDKQNSDGSLTFEFSCESAFGKEYQYNNEVNVREWLDNSSYVVGYEEDTKARQALEGIESNLCEIKDGI